MQYYRRRRQSWSFCRSDLGNVIIKEVVEDKPHRKEVSSGNTCNTPNYRSYTALGSYSCTTRGGNHGFGQSKPLGKRHPSNNG